MKKRWTPRPLPVLALLLAVALCGETVAADQGWVPIAAPSPLRPHRTTEAPRFGSRIIKPRLPRQEGVTDSTTSKPVSTTPTIKSSTPKPVSSSTRSPRQQPNTDDEEETKSLAQQVADGKYGLIQNELFAKRPARPGIISYAPNPEVPNDNKDNLGGLRPEEIWLAEDHVLVLSGGPLGAEGHWKPIDNYEAPPRQVKLPPNPSVPPPFPVQLQDGGPTGFITSNGTNPFLFRQAPPGNFEPGNGIFPPRPPPPFPHHNGSYIPPPQPGLFRQENLTLDDDDPSIFYPPPYDFSFRQDNSTEVPPGPLVPGIVLPPPPSFFAPQNKSASPALFIPDDIYNNVEPPLDELDRPSPLPPVRVPRPPRPPARPVLVVTTTTPPPAVFISTTPASENEIFVPDYPVKEPNVILHHHGTPVQFISTKNTSSRVVVSPPEKLVVYELPGLPPPPRSGGRTVVSSTPAPASIYYTLPDQAPVKFTIYSATPDPVKQLDYFFATPRPQQYSTVKPKYQEPVYYDAPTTTPQPIYLYPDTTLAPETTTAAPIIATTKAPKKHTTKAPKYLPPFDPSDYDFPTTTPAPVYFNPVPKGRYLPNIQDDYYYEQGYQQPPRYVPSRPAPRPNDYYYGPPRRPEVFYNPRPDPNYFYPAPPPPRRPSPTQAPAYDNDNYYYQNPQRRPQPRPEVGFYYPPPQRNPPASTTPNPVFNGYFTPQDEKYMDDITKSYFNIFGQRITTPLPPLAATEPIPTSVSLHDDTRVNYRRPLPPINPDSEFIDVRGAGRDPSVVSYQLPGQGQRGPSHYYFLTPRLNSDERLPRDGVRSPRQGARTPRDNSANRSPKVTNPLQQTPDNTKKH